MINRIKTHNILNGIIFGIVEFVIASLVITPFAIYYITHGRTLYAIIAIGIILNSLTFVAFGLQQYRRKEKDIGIQHMFNKSVRERIGREHPHLSNDTWVLTSTILLPYVMFLWVKVTVAFMPRPPLWPVPPRLISRTRTSTRQSLRRAYGWRSDLSDEETLEKILALNLERGK